jgi:hypothetical protein
MIQPKIYLYTKFIGIPQTQDFYPLKEEGFFEDYDKYIHDLFNEQRIESRLFYFKELTLPTVLNQTYQNFEWIIFISNLLPIKYKQFVRSISDKIIVIEIDKKRISNQELIELHSSKENNYISVRLDDDDGLCIDYFELLLKTYSTNNSLIGSRNMLIVTHDGENLLYSKMSKNFLVSSGFCCKNQHVYQIGGHANAQSIYSYDLIDKKYPSIQSGGKHTFTKRDHVSDVNIFSLNKYINNEYE